MFKTPQTQQISLTRMRWSKADVAKPTMSQLLLIFSDALNVPVKHKEVWRLVHKYNKVSDIDQIWVKAFAPRRHHETLIDLFPEIFTSKSVDQKKKGVEE
jgi:hypothetical protein